MQCNQLLPVFGSGDPVVPPGEEPEQILTKTINIQEWVYFIKIKVPMISVLANASIYSPKTTASVWHGRPGVPTMSANR